MFTHYMLVKCKQGIELINVNMHMHLTT